MTAATIVLLAIALAYATVTDMRARIIPNRLTFPMLAGGLILQAVGNGQAGLITGLEGGGLALLIMIFPFALGWVGAGDVKLAMVVGVLMGLDYAPAAFLFTALAAGAIAVAELIRQRQFFATLKCLLLMWYLPMPKESALKSKLPYAPAMAGGCAVALFMTFFAGFDLWLGR